MVEEKAENFIRFSLSALQCIRADNRYFVLFRAVSDNSLICAATQILS